MLSPNPATEALTLVLILKEVYQENKSSPGNGDTAPFTASRPRWGSQS